jgi:excisionase family DNA binding protein
MIGRPGIADVIRQATEEGQRQLQRVTISVPEAGKKLGIGRNAAYEAARRGEIPVIRLGKRIVVPTAAFEKMLAVRTKAQIVAAELERRLRADEPETI